MLVAVVIITLVRSCYSADFFHQTPEQFKLAQGWQEPGLWRPKWIMDRVFDDSVTEDEEGNEITVKGYRDRVVFRMKNDRTMKIFSQQNRPKLEILKAKVASEKKKKLFETGDEVVLTLKEKWKKARLESKSSDEAEGTWWWQDESPLNQGLVKLEVRDGPPGSTDRIRHDIRCDWGKIDGYAAKFRRGKILKYKMTEAGVPLGTYVVGSFSIRASPHRPLISKEYIAFE